MFFLIVVIFHVRIWISAFEAFVVVCHCLVDFPVCAGQDLDGLLQVISLF